MGLSKRKGFRVCGLEDFALLNLTAPSGPGGLRVPTVILPFPLLSSFPLFPLFFLFLSFSSSLLIFPLFPLFFFLWVNRTSQALQSKLVNI